MSLLYVCWCVLRHKFIKQADNEMNRKAAIPEPIFTPCEEGIIFVIT